MLLVSVKERGRLFFFLTSRSAVASDTRACLFMQFDILYIITK